MKVAELIAWLSAQNPDAEVLLQDPDTGWFLPLRSGAALDYTNDKPAPDAVIVHARYGDRR